MSNNKTRKRNNQFADFDAKVFERGAKERAQKKPVEYTGYETRKRCPKGTRWNSKSQSCQSQSVLSILGDPLGALRESVLPLKKTASKSKSKTMSMPKVTKSRSMSKTQSMPKSSTTSIPAQKPSVSARRLPKTRIVKKSSSKRSKQRKSSGFIGLDDFYSTPHVDVRQLGLNDFLDSNMNLSSLKKSKSKPKSKPKTKSYSPEYNTAELADRQAFLEEDYSPQYNTAELADREAFLNEKSTTKRSYVPKESNNSVRFYGTQRIVTSKK